MSLSLGMRPITQRALDVLRRAGNPFRNCFARNPDDEACDRYHVPELFATQREQLLSVVDLYRYDPQARSGVVPVLGNKGSGKTHLLHSIKHGGGAWQLLVTPGTFPRDTDFLEYLLFQVIDTLLSGGRQNGNRPLEYIGDEVSRQQLRSALGALSPSERLALFPRPGWGRWSRRLGLGSAQAQERCQWLLDQLTPAPNGGPARRVRQLCPDAELDLQVVCNLACEHAERSESHDAGGLMRRHIHQGILRAALLDDESALAEFLTHGFAELDFQVRPGRQDLVLSLFKVLMACLLRLRVPVVVAFDQLEDLLLARRHDDGRRTAEAFFAGIVHAMHQVDGLCFLLFAERGLWNRFVPSLDGYIQDRINNPVHLPGHGTLKTLRLEAPPPDLVRSIVQARLRPTLHELPDFDELSATYPFTEEQILQVARTEPTLRDMLQQFRHLFDRLVFDQASAEMPKPEGAADEAAELSEGLPPGVKSLIVVETPPGGPKMELAPDRLDTPHADAPPGVRPAAGEPCTLGWLRQLWQQEVQAARTRLAPEGSIPGATRELQSGLGQLLSACHEQGVKVGPWRLQHVVDEFTFGDHPTYGVLSIAHWACKDAPPWKVGIGLFLGRGAGKPKDLEVKLAAMEMEPRIVDHLILLRAEEDLNLSGKSKAIWGHADRQGRHARLEPMTLDGFAALYAFPRWLAAVTEAQPDASLRAGLGQFLQDQCEKLLEQLCMPIPE